MPGLRLNILKTEKLLQKTLDVRGTLSQRRRLKKRKKIKLVVKMHLIKVHEEGRKMATTLNIPLYWNFTEATVNRLIVVKLDKYG